MKGDFDENEYSLPSDYESVAVSKVKQDLRSCSVHAISALPSERGFDQVDWHANTSAGFGYEDKDGHFQKKGAPGCYSSAKRRAAALLGNYKDSEDKRDYLVRQGPLDAGFFRTQLSPRISPKIRSIFGRQFHVILLEGLFATPLLAWFCLNSSIFAVGLNLFQQSLLMRRYVRDDAYWVTGDWRSFDRTCLEAEIRFAFSVLREMLVIEDELTLIAWELVVEMFILTRVSMPDGFAYLTRGLIPSGSFLTGLVDSIINAFRLRYIQMKLAHSYTSLTLLGDDFLFLCRRKVTARDINNLFSRMPCLLKEGVLCATSYDDLKFLGHQVKSGILYRDSLEIVRLAVHPELPRSPLATRQALMALFLDSGCRYHYLYAAANLLRIRNDADANELVFDDSTKLYDRY
uniref:RdRp n=1 Tax=viral metagenome TaxID=1070528 RepID=A0A2V0RL62_9ZZZZ